MEKLKIWIKKLILWISPYGVISVYKNRRKIEKPAPQIGKIHFGDLGRLTPIGNDFGFRRGGPVDRYYIEKFLKESEADIRGRALEIKDDTYIKRYGGNKVTKADILDLDSTNPRATVVADLTKADQIPDNAYDCIVLTQTLQLIYDLRSAVKHCYRILKPSGVLLVTVPGISHLLHHKYGQYWCWCFTENSVRKLLAEFFQDQKVTTRINGNVFVAASFLYGVGSGELTSEEYDYTDKDYAVIITARAVK